LRVTLALQLAGEGDGVVNGEPRAEADAEVGGMSGIPHQHGLAVIPVPVGYVTEVQPGDL
jgi:hypothetical protein